MKLFEWLCGCDSPHRDESTQYITAQGSNGVYAEKKPVICTEQPKPIAPIEQTQINGAKKVNGCPVSKTNGFTPLQQNGHTENGHCKVEEKKPSTNNKMPPPTKIPPPTQKSTDSQSLSVPDFELVMNNIQSYRELVRNVRAIMTDRQVNLENLIQHQQLPDEVDSDVRAARGKIIVIVKNNLTTFEKLLKDATDEPQQIADLTGFWGIIHKELVDVQKACARVEASRLNQWKPVARPVTPPPTPSTIASSRGKTPAKSAAGPQTPGRTPKANPNLRAFMAQKRKEMQSNEKLAADS